MGETLIDYFLTNTLPYRRFFRIEKKKFFFFFF